MERDFEQVTDVYAGLPLKKNFLVIGVLALKENGAPDYCVPEIEDGKIVLNVFHELYYTEESFMEECHKWMDEGMTLEEAIEACKDDRFAYKEILAVIELKQENGETIVGNIEGDFGVYRDKDDEAEYIDYLDMDWYLSDEEELQMCGLTETFLNAVVDLDKM